MIKRLLRPKNEMPPAGAQTFPNYSVPTNPSTLYTGDHQARNYQNDEDLRSVPIGRPGATPYLGLRARLSQVWINKWTILLLLVLVRALFAVASLNTDLAYAKTEALAACQDVESMGSAMASMPHYLSQGVNDLTATGVEKAVNGLMSMLLLSISAVEEIVVFVINLLTSTYVCLITLVIAGSLHVAIQVAEDVTSFLNKTLGDIGTDIHNDINSFQNDLNKFTSALNSVPKIFGSSSTVPTLNIDPDLNKLNNIQLPPTIDEGLNKLNSSIPTFAQVQNFTDNVIRTPFEVVKNLVNESLVAYHFDRSVFPVPQKEQMTFCSNNDDIDNFFVGLVKIAFLVKKIFIIVLCILAALACIPMAYREVWRWRTVRKRAQMLTNHAFDPLDVVQIATHPYSSTAGIKVASKFRSPRRQALVRWGFSYATTTPALFVLVLGLAGLGGCLCQYILLKTITKEVPVIANEVGDFAGEVVDKLNNASLSWALGVNHVINSTNDDINKDVFGWVNTTTSAVNDTLNAFVDQMTDALNATFGGTVLYQPITGVLNCLIGLKIAGIEKGLTWVSDNAHVEFPLLPNNTFSLGAAASISGDPQFTSKVDSFLADPGSDASDKISGALVAITDKIYDQIRTEALISAGVVLIWVAIMIIGLVVTIIRLFGRDRHRAEGGTDYLTDEKGPAAAGLVPPVYTQSQTGSREDRVWEQVPLGRHSHTASSSSEKVGFAGERSGAVLGQGHERASSYGEMAGGKA